MQQSLSISLIFSLFLILACKKSADPFLHKHHGQPSSQNQRYQTILENYAAATQAPGTLLLVNKPGEKTWIGAVGKAELSTNRAMKTNTPFRAGSITKVVVAAYVLKLVDQRRLKLTTPVKNLLPEIIHQIPGAENVTIQQLLAHLSGVFDPSNESEEYRMAIIADPVAFSSLSVQELIRTYVYGKPVHFTPGSSYSYSNTGYWLLGLIIEKIEGAPLHRVLEQKIFKPLKLRNTYLEARQSVDVAHGYADVDGSGIQDVSIYDRADGDGKAASGLITTAADLCTYFSALFNGKLISSPLLNEMKKLQLLDCNSDDCRYGLGLEEWNVNGLKAHGHNGSSIGYEANALFFEKSKTIVITYKNLGGGSDKSFLYELGK